jgi:hypothetical protein
MPGGSLLYFLRNQVLLPAASATVGLPSATQPTAPAAVIRTFTAAR